MPARHLRLVSCLCVALLVACGSDEGSSQLPLGECQPRLLTSLEVGSSVVMEMALEGSPQVTTLFEWTFASAVTFEGRQAYRRLFYFTRTIPDGDRTLVDRQGSTSYLERTEDGLLRELGFDHQQTGDFYSGPVIRIVYGPPNVDTSFTLLRGQSLEQTYRGTSLNLEQAAVPTPFEYRQSVRFEDRDSLLINGKVYDTCRYLYSASEVAMSRAWYHVGTGVPLREESYGAPATTLEMRSLIVNGEKL